MTLRFGHGNWATLSTLKSCTIAMLEGQRIPGDLVIRTGLEVLRTLEHFKREKPDQVPKIPGGGLLGPSMVPPAPVDDFRLAETLFPDSLVQALAVSQGLFAPKLLSYVAVVCVQDNVPSQTWIDSALQYVFNEMNKRNSIFSRVADDLYEKVKLLQPLADTGTKFRSGKKRGSAGPLVKAIRKHLKKRPGDNPADILAAFFERPPKGMIFRDSPSLGKYIEYDPYGSARDTSYRRFQNCVYQERKAE